MGQTLTHGVYLPDEGERNCYSGLAANWQILDTSVGTIASHTAALAGKAPAVHTHTKSDVTDLLDSNFIPSANNSYDLGSSSYQWNNLYASKIRQVDSFSSYADVYQVLDSSSNRIVSFRITKGTNKNTLGINVHDQNNSAPKGLVIENDLSNNITITGGGINNYLGTSTNKWKSLNGVNPGALSLPDTLGTSGTENVNYFNVIGYLNNTGTLATIPSTAAYDGWLYINAKDGTDSYIIIDDSPSGFGSSVYGNNGLGVQGFGLLCLICPIRKGHYYNVRIKSAGIVSARIYPAQGNV